MNGVRIVLCVYPALKPQFFLKVVENTPVVIDKLLGCLLKPRMPWMVECPLDGGGNCSPYLHFIFPYSPFDAPSGRMSCDIDTVFGAYHPRARATFGQRREIAERARVQCHYWCAQSPRIPTELAIERSCLVEAAQ